MHILHVTPYYERAWAYGGIPRVVSALARGLARRGHAVTVCTTDARDARSRLPRTRVARRASGGVQLRVFANLSNLAAYHLQAFAPIGLDRYLRRHAGSFEVAQLHGCHNLPGVLAARRLVQAGVPYAVTPNGTAPLIERRQTAKWLFDHSVGRQVLPAASRVLAVTEVERRQLESLGVPSGRIRVLPNPVDLEEYTGLQRGRFRRRLGLGDETRLLLYLGRFSPRKRLDVVVDAAARLPRGQDLRLVLAGNDMGYGRQLRRRLRQTSKLQRRTRLVPLLRGRERLEALADADLVLYPGADEIFGLVVLESLLCGTPVLVADDCGAAELVGQLGGGLALPVGDAGALSRGIQRLLGEAEQWRGAARAAAAQIRARFGADTVCAGLEQLYRGML